MVASYVPCAPPPNGAIHVTETPVCDSGSWRGSMRPGSPCKRLCPLVSIMLEEFAMSMRRVLLFAGFALSLVSVAAAQDLASPRYFDVEPGQPVPFIVYEGER